MGKPSSWGDHLLVDLTPVEAHPHCGRSTLESSAVTVVKLLAPGVPFQSRQLNCMARLVTFQLSKHASFESGLPKDMLGPAAGHWSKFESGELEFGFVDVPASRTLTHSGSSDDASAIRKKRRKPPTGSANALPQRVVELPVKLFQRAL